MFMQPDPKNFHVQYIDVNRHWSPRSEKYAGGDNLLTAIMRGWEIGNLVTLEQHWNKSGRCVSIYTFLLRKGDREIAMHVIENPYVSRLLYTQPFEIVTAGGKPAEHHQQQQAG